MEFVQEGYKQTKIGIIPEDWKVLKFDELFYELKEKVGNQNYETYSISAGVGFLSQKDRFGKDISGSQNKNYIILKGKQFSYNKGNSKSYKYGCVYLNNTNKIIAVPNVFISFDLKDIRMNTSYFSKLFENHYLDKELRKIISSSARMDGLLNINKKHFFQIPMICPSINEQNKIAEILETWDNVILKSKELISLKENLKKGLVTKLLLNLEGKVKEIRLEETVKKIIDNRGKTPLLSKSGKELIEIASISNSKYPDFKKVKKFVSDDIYNSWFRNGHPLTGDILVGTVGNAGVNSIVKENRGCIAQNVIALRFKESVNSSFIYYLMNTDYYFSKVKAVVMGAVQPSLKVPDLLSFKFKFPELEKQNTIVKILSLADKEIELLKEELSQLEIQRKGLMQKLLTGDVRVKI